MTVSSSTTQSIMGVLNGNGLSLLVHGGGLPLTAMELPNDVHEENGGGAITMAGLIQAIPTMNMTPVRPNQVTQRIQRNTKANITVATLNMRGRASTTLGPSPISKWAEISNLMKKNRIGILALQEMHLMEEYLSDIHKLHGRRLLVLNSSMGTNTGGVAFVLNREITNTQNITTKMIMPGRALLMTLPWHQTSKITLLNIYAPNNYETHPLFWSTIQTQILNANMKPDMMLGDFNLVEDPLDRAPARLDNEGAATALRDLRTALNLQDEWRHTFPTTRQFTFRSHAGTMSQIDRIYTEASHQNHLFQWLSGPSNVPTNHDMVSIRYAPRDAPQIGRGRWTWPLHMINDNKLLNIVINKGIELENKLMGKQPHNTNNINPQTLWENYKTEITAIARKRARAATARLDHRINSLKKDLARTANEQGIDTNLDS